MRVSSLLWSYRMRGWSLQSNWDYLGLHGCSVVSDSLWPQGTHQAPLSMVFPRKEYWRGLLLPPPGDLPNFGINLSLFCLLHWEVGSLPLSHQGGLSWSLDFNFSKICFASGKSLFFSVILLDFCFVSSCQNVLFFREWVYLLSISL